MTTQHVPRVRSVGCQSVVSRRHLLQIGGLGLMGLSLPRLLAAESALQASGGPKPRADACVLIFLNGGPSHLDMWDMKPQAPSGIRGEFNPIATSVPGIQFSEHLPKLAAHAHQSTIVRSMHHTVNNAHAAAVYTSLTGHDRGDNVAALGGGSREYPAIGSVLGMLRPTEQAIVPHVCLPYITKEGAGGPPQSGFFGGLLGRAYDPLFVLKDPNSKDFAVPELTLLTDVSVERLSARQALFRQLDERFERGPGRAAYDGMDGFRRRALNLLTSEATQRALRIGDEAEPVRERYGRNIYGQSVLLARRLIEAGTRMVTISWAPDANATWDTHGSNFKKLKNTLLPQFDAAASSLVADLAERGLLERTLVAVLGDFGRSPKINAADGGRDHWNYCYSLMLIGGGVRGGYVHGASDKIGAFPARDPLVPGDVISTIYHMLGIANDHELRDGLDRPYRLVPAGSVVPSLLA
jgi:hypothetical protein